MSLLLLPRPFSGVLCSSEQEGVEGADDDKGNLRRLVPFFIIVLVHTLSLWLAWHDSLLSSLPSIYLPCSHLRTPTAYFATIAASPFFPLWGDYTGF